MSTNVNHKDIFKSAIEAQARAVSGLLNKIPEDLSVLCEKILSNNGKLVITGMGKSGIIGRKIAATLASTGTPSFFVHPGEAYHGDLGMIGEQDHVLAISNSGETEEVLKVIAALKHSNNYLIAMTGRPGSTLAQNADFHIDISVDEEACPLQLAPTSSTTATLVVGDAIAIMLMTARGFQPSDFARYHPGGSLGRRLLTTVDMVMKKDALPVVAPSDSLSEVAHAISEGRCGLAVICDECSNVQGIITDGDLRRAMDSSRMTFFDLRATDVMTYSPITIPPGTMLIDAEELMSTKKINSLLVVDSGKLRGIVQIYDL